MHLYLDTPIVAQASSLVTPRYGMTRAGYTKASGAPTSRLVQVQGEKRFRRVMVWQFSNAGTCFVRIKDEPHIIPDSDLI